jgi:hypothetical protein
MTAFHSNLALHISETTYKARRRLAQPERSRHRHVLWGLLGAAAIWSVALSLMGA